jgi:hypothetical protein
VTTSRSGGSVRFAVALDPPGETKRQALTLGIWLFFLAAAVVAAVAVGTHAPGSIDDVGSREAEAELARSRSARLKVAILVGLVAPSFFTLLLARRHRRNGGHPRGITVDLTEDELRVWGRGYGSRVTLADATSEERLVDVYGGRLGAWRQIRLRVRSGYHTIELAAPAKEGDELTLSLEGGEGDCVELAREDYEALRRELLARR